MGFAERSFDALICSHVLEHVPDDRAAMKECRRLLRPGGWLVIQIPMHPLPTDEDPSLVDPVIRQQRFGQDDHVRMYGPDVVQRLQDAGFHVTMFPPVPPAAVVRPADGEVGIPATEPPVIFCRPAGSATP
jgi:SAM-dependent methyltransferase